MNDDICFNLDTYFSKEKWFSDEKTVLAITENPYLQYFIFRKLSHRHLGGLWLD